MHLVACPDCSRPYDASRLAPGSRIRCACATLFPVGAPRELVASALRCDHCGGAAEPEDARCRYCGAELDRRGSLLCPSCWTRLPEDARHCSSCAADVRPQALAPLPPDARCPRCEGELVLRTLSRSSVVECDRCGGLWLRPETFEELLREAPHGRTPPAGGAPAGSRPDGTEPVRYVPCPDCGDLMQRRLFRHAGRWSRVLIDQCGAHGVWLDASELEEIVRFVAASGGAGRGSMLVRRATAAADPPLGSRARSSGTPALEDALRWLGGLVGFRLL